MKIIKFIFTLLVIAFIGGFGYFSFTDVPITQTEVTKDIPNERLFSD